MTQQHNFLSKSEARQRVLGIMDDIYQAIPANRWFLRLAFRSRMIMVNFEEFRNLKDRKGFVSGLIDGLNSLMTFNIGANFFFFLLLILNIGSTSAQMAFFTSLMAAQLVSMALSRSLLDRYIPTTWTEEHSRQLMISLGNGINQAMGIDQLGKELPEEVVLGITRSANDGMRYLNNIIEQPHLLFRFFSDESLNLLNLWIKIDNNLPTDVQRFRNNWTKLVSDSEVKRLENN